MPTCPKCNKPMEPDQRISIGGIRDKPVHWHCAQEPIEAEAVHPVQMVHLRIGQQSEHDGRLSRIIQMDMVGAELMVYREAVTPPARREDPSHA